MRAEKSNAAARITKGKGALHVVKIENAMDALNLFAQGKAGEFVASAQQTTNQSIESMYLLLIFLVLAMVLFTVYLTRSITRPIAVLQRAAMEIGKGKLQMPLAIHTGGELGALAISFRGMPVAILTSSEADADMAKAYAYNASSYLVKPLDFTTFKQLLDDLGFYWLCWNKYPWTEE